MEGEWLLFASEIKALLATGLVPARPDPRGIDQIFTFFAQPGPVTCFEGVQALLPGHYLSICQGPGEQPARIEDHVYWEMDYPAQGDELQGRDPGPLVDRLEELLVQAVTRRLRADVPVAAYLSGGVDSSLVLAMANRVCNRPLPSFTIRIQEPYLDETGPAHLAADHLGAKPVIVSCGAAEILGAYPALFRACEYPSRNDYTCACGLAPFGARGSRTRLQSCPDRRRGRRGTRRLPLVQASAKLMGHLDTVPGLPLGR